MGYMKHHAIVITGWEYDQVDAAFRYAGQIGMTKTTIIESPINSYWSFMIVPDGSKEGWESSNTGDLVRKNLVGWLLEIEPGHGGRKRYALDWAEIVYGDEAGPARIEWSSDR